MNIPTSGDVGVRKICFQINHGALGIGLSAFTFAHLFTGLFQGRQDAEIGFHGLEVGHVCMGYVMAQCPQHGGGRQGVEWLAFEQARGVDPCQQAGSDVAHIAFHAGDLPGEEQVISGFMLQGGAQQLRAGQKGVAVHLPIAYELGVFQAGDQT